jgi:kynureninase
MQFENTLAFAQAKDTNDELAGFRKQYHIPKGKNGEVIYLCGNSLGLQPNTVGSYINMELEHWKNHGVEGHFEGDRPWMHYHKNFEKFWSDLIGARVGETVVMNSLSVNLHLLMVSFYRPTKSRYKILMEGHAFPSDQYAAASQVIHHGHIPKDAIIELNPRKGEYTLRNEDILEKIADLGDELALVLFPGIQYYTGQFFDINAITQVAHKVGAIAGFDLAHAVGNVPMNLHDWEVDFATWCSYKYLNSGPGGVSGIFVHETHGKNTSIPRFAGWWGHDEQIRFKMTKDFVPTPTAEGWQLSNAPVLSMAAHLAALELFAEAGMVRLRAKSLLLSSYYRWLLESLIDDDFKIITPKSDSDRGTQLSILIQNNGRKVFEYLQQNDIIVDWREPNVIRLAATAMYNTFEEAYIFNQKMRAAIATV